MAIIRHTLELVRDRLNEFIRNTAPRSEHWVVLGNVVDQSGQTFAAHRDKLLMILANIQHETVISTYNRNAPVEGGQYAVVAPPLYIDLFVLIYANFYDKNYAEGLSFISRAISFFQQNPWFTHANLPGLPAAIDKLTFEFTNLDVTSLNHLMGMLGAKYLPSVYYKVRMIPFRSEAMQGQTPPASGYEASGVAPEEPNTPPSPGPRGGRR